MRVVLLKDLPSGSAGTVLTHGSAWRLAFPVKGCVGRPHDSEAVDAVAREIETTDGQTKGRLLDVMAQAGTWPVTLETVVTVEPSQEIALAVVEPEPVIEDEPPEQLLAVPVVPLAVEQRHNNSKKHRNR
jgi:hypothetical protein